MQRLIAPLLVWALGHGVVGWGCRGLGWDDVSMTEGDLDRYATVGMGMNRGSQENPYRPDTLLV